MTNYWIPGATIVKATQDGGAMTGGPAKVIWHTTENDPTTVSALAIAQYLNRIGSQVHIVWNPTTGQIVQSIPANRGARGLVNASGGVETNRGGSVVLQIEVVGRATKPFTNGPCVNLDKLLAFIKQLGVPGVWPAGIPKPYPASYGGVRSATAWSHGGHFGHSQVPENLHGDPGAVNTYKLTAYAVSTAPKPVPTTATPQGPFPLALGAGYTTGSTGWGVHEIQALVGCATDGQFGPNTALHVKAWTTKNGPYATAVVNKQVWDHMAGNN